MVIDLIDKLIDRIIQLAKYRKASNRKLLVHFVEPCYSEFEAVHADYLKSFLNYRNMITVSAHGMQELVRKIDEDNLFSLGLREKVKALTEVWEDPVVGGFVKLIHEYLTNPFEFNPSRRAWRRKDSPQRWRLTLQHALIVVDKEDKGNTKVALETLDIIVEQMQELYSLVTLEYLGLKRKLFP